MGQRRIGPLPKNGINSELQFSFYPFLKFLYTFLAKPHSMRDLSSLLQWIEPMLPALEAWSLQLTTRKFRVSFCSKDSKGTRIKIRLQLRDDTSLSFNSWPLLLYILPSKTTQ